MQCGRVRECVNFSAILQKSLRHFDGESQIHEIWVVVDHKHVGFVGA